LAAAPPPPPPWNQGVTKAAFSSARLGKSSSGSSIGEVLCVGDMLYDCIAQDGAKGWPIDKVVIAMDQYSRFAAYFLCEWRI
jgi:hypothetical protein